jgi:hypothetical protein
MGVLADGGAAAAAARAADEEAGGAVLEGDGTRRGYAAMPAR